MSLPVLSVDALRRALLLPDLTDPADGPHALQLLVSGITTALTGDWGCACRLHRAGPVVSVADNYDRLHYPPDGEARHPRYSRYVCETALLRTQISALIPGLLRSLSSDPPADALLACPGMVYRRDSIDRLHTSEPHQLDLWRIRRDQPLGNDELEAMIAVVLGAALPGRAWRVIPTTHPYTLAGREIQVADGERWIEVGECGLALPALLEEAGLPSSCWSGLAMGLGLDRLLMLRKGMDDIRLLRSQAPSVREQMQDLGAYRPVSSMPSAYRDLSLAVDSTACADDESLGDAVREALGEEAGLIASVILISQTPYQDLPLTARSRLGITPDQKNILMRLELRALDRSLTSAECNRLRDRIASALQRGSGYIPG